MSLRRLINLRIILSVIVILILGGATAVWQARQSVDKEVRSSINLALQMIEFGFAQVPVSSRYGSDWLSQISAVQQARHLRISIKDSAKKTVEFITQREVDENSTIPPDWFIKIVTTQYVTAKYDINMADGSVKTIVITSDPMDEIIEAWGESKAFFLSIATMLGIIFIAINLVFQTMVSAVQAIRNGLREVEHGEYGKTLPRFNISEFDAIATEINVMSAALKTAKNNNQALAKHTIQIQESERQTLSRELHDEMGQSLTAVKAMAVTIKQPNVEVQNAADSIIDVCNHLAGVVRSMMRTLHPLSLSELGLGATLTDLTNEWRRRHVELSVTFDYDPPLELLAKHVAIHVYRIVQECLTNVVRHAKASQVIVSVKLSGTTRAPLVIIVVKDNGVGGQATNQGFGILGMRERVESLGGHFSFESSEDEGVTVSAQMPYIKESDDK